MKQETYYVVVDPYGRYLSADFDWTLNFPAATLFHNTEMDITYAHLLAESNNGTVKEVTITIKD
jgi:hypothetical protein